MLYPMIPFVVINSPTIRIFKSDVLGKMSFIVDDFNKKNLLGSYANWYYSSVDDRKIDKVAIKLTEPSATIARYKRINIYDICCSD
jgi:hypothetical protein